MYIKAKKSQISGKITIPGSKSHTIRSLFIASLANGTSIISNPLISNDAISAVDVCRIFGADIRMEKNHLIVNGFGDKPKVPEDIINVGNSGTTLRFGMGVASLCDGYSVFTGDYQIKRRMLAPLIKALNNLGAVCLSTRENGLAPIIIKGVLKGGKTDLDSVTSQFLSALLISAPLAKKNTEITLTRLNEIPYVEMTFWWLERQGIKFENHDFKKVTISGNQKYEPFNISIPGDFSSATFFMVLAAITGGKISLQNLDITDPQGDKLVLKILESMGATIKINSNRITIKGNKLKGQEIDMNSIPDALPAMAVAGCFAEGETRLINVEQARIKETDRIKVMCEELSKMGADIKELPDGLHIKKSKLKGCSVKGHYDHRIVMALAVAGMNSEGETIIDTAEAINVTFPDFIKVANECGGEIEIC